MMACNVHAHNMTFELTDETAESLCRSRTEDRPKGRPFCITVIL